MKSAEVGGGAGMSADDGNLMAEYDSRHTVIKNSWKGKYMRIFCVSSKQVATINPQGILCVTNSWDYGTQLVNVAPAPNNTTEFSITANNKGKQETLNFTSYSTAERAELLTDVQRNRALFDVKYKQQLHLGEFSARKYGFGNVAKQCRLRVSAIAVEQLDSLGNVIGEYLFMHMKGITSIQDNPKSLVLLYGPLSKMHLYELENPGAIIQCMVEHARRYVGITSFPSAEKMSQQTFAAQRLGVDLTKLPPTAQFPVMKLSPRHGGAPVRRVFLTTNDYLQELDVDSYNTVSVYTFANIHTLVRCEKDDQKFTIQFCQPAVSKVYTSPMRDALLSHIVDCCRTVGNNNAHVSAIAVSRGKRTAPLSAHTSEEVESTLLNCLVDPYKYAGPVVISFSQVVEFFNANIEYTGPRFTENREGLFAENREKMIFSALLALLNNLPKGGVPIEFAQQFYALRRLCVTRIGFSSAAVVPTLVKSIEKMCTEALNMNNVTVSHAMIDFINVLMVPHHDHYEMAHEGANKNRILGDENFVCHIIRLLHDYAATENASLVVQALLDFFVYALCPPYCDTTNARHFNWTMTRLVEMAGKELFSLSQHSCDAISVGAGQLIRAIMEEGTPEQFAAMQRMALSEGAILRQLHTALFSKSRNLRDLARRLIAFWAFQNPDVQELMRCILPPAFLYFLQSREEPPEDELEKERTKSVVAMSMEYWESKTGWFKKRFHPTDVLGRTAGGSAAAQTGPEMVQLRVRNVRVKPTLNWNMLFYQVKQDHVRPDLIWNHTTRNELREALEAEMQAFRTGLEMQHKKLVSWNYREFEVQYLSLKDELKVGEHYLRLLFESGKPVVARPKDFFNDVYHRFLLAHDDKTRLECLRGMSILYEHYANAIGQFNDTAHIVHLLRTTLNSMFRDHLLLFIAQLIRARVNVKLFLNCDGLKLLVDMLPLAHLHVDRPQIVCATNAIECSGDSAFDLQDHEKEWYYVKDNEKQEPVTYTCLKQLYADGVITDKTKVWAKGLSGWMELVDVQQLRWGLVSQGGNRMLTFSEVSCTVLDILTRLCDHYPSKDDNGAVMQPLPLVKRYLSSPQVLPHIVQLLLTFDPGVCSRVHTLLCTVMDENPTVSQFFLTGVFFFTLMYTGSDVLPMCRMLDMSHKSQSCHIYPGENEIVQHSVLRTMIPPALVCYLTNHGPERFADVWLGEYETPEAIWNKDMRRHLVDKIASHVADFTPRLFSNIRAVYQYCPIVRVTYEQLKQELFCAQFYLRHLCDEVRYPNWPIADPVFLLREALMAWQSELSKKPSGLTRDGCLEELDITDRGHITPQSVRKAYYKLAALHHPDKNPDGREKFERIQLAYEFLASNTVESDEPNPQNIELILRTQAILYKRFGELLSQYKYAGYNLLLRLMQMEYDDPNMFCKEVVLMVPAVELCYLTVRNVSLNADELREEGGIELLSKVMQRCFESITPNSGDSLVQVKILRNTMMTFAVAAHFHECCVRIYNEPMIPHLAAKGIAFEKAAALSRACIQTCRSLCVDEVMQESVIREGAIWHLLVLLFRYDATVEDSGIELQEEHHSQLYANRAAVNALQAVYAMAGIAPSEKYPKTKRNEQILRMLNVVFTPYVVEMMITTDCGEKELLKLLNMNHETPYLLWNNDTREELLDILKHNSEKCFKAGLNCSDVPSLVAEDISVEQACMTFLIAALSESNMVQQAFERGLYVVVLHLIATTSHHTVKNDACLVLVKIFSDKIWGHKSILRASKLLPPVILETMKENTAAACQLLDTWQETPELVWSKDRRARFVEKCSAFRTQIVELLQREPTATWTLPDTDEVEDMDDLRVGGVYVKRYLNQPGWIVRKPKEFLVALLERFVEECMISGKERSVDTIVIIADSTLRLLQTTQNLVDYIVSIGYAQKLFMLLDCEDEVVAENALKLVREECDSATCVESFVNFDPVACLVAYQRKHPTRLPIFLDTLQRLISHSSERANMMPLALNNRIPHLMFEWLETGLTPEVCGDLAPAAVRALIIKVLKAMLALQDPIHGPQLEAILASNPIWEKYKEQSHDLFLSNVRIGGYLDAPQRNPQQQQQLLSITFSAQGADNDGEPPPI
uniref:Putative endosomal trafficking protein RME-8 n=1 Tax=Trypanosoma vivax (strain Y486) TaxID=1055687 RepID=G0TX19_TRYVY|nr:putative endosomal trafficking protein RME-8, fragment [Trypanosoma vivax Y486]